MFEKPFAPCLAVICACLGLVLAGCASNSNDTPGEAAPTSVATTVPTANVQTSPTPTPTSTPNEPDPLPEPTDDFFNDATEVPDSCHMFVAQATASLDKALASLEERRENMWQLSDTVIADYDKRIASVDPGSMEHSILTAAKDDFQWALLAENAALEAESTELNLARAQMLTNLPRC